MHAHAHPSRSRAPRLTGLPLDGDPDAAPVDAWLSRTSANRTRESLLALFEAALRALWARTHPTLGEVTLNAIAERVFFTVSEKFPSFAALKVEPIAGVQLTELAQRINSVPDAELVDGIRFVLVELIRVLGNLTAEILSPELRSELDALTHLPPAEPPPPLRRPRPSALQTSLEEANFRLQALCELGKLFTRSEQLEQTLDPAIGLVADALPLHSAVLIQVEANRSLMTVWHGAGRTAAQMEDARKRGEAAYAYFIGAAPRDLNLHEQKGKTALPAHDPEGGTALRFIAIPLVVSHRRAFGVLQLEGAAALDKSDLMFVSAIANQFAIAIDRARAWDREIERRVEAEERTGNAERRGADAERERVLSDSSRNEFQALAEENAALYQEAQQAVAVREQILAVVSHDLRNPLATILLAASTLSEDQGAPRPQTIAMIGRSARRMHRLIEDLLDFASIEVGNLAIKSVLEDPTSLVDETLAAFEGVAAQKQLRVTGTVAAPLGKVSFDRDRILQVLSNLVGNATKVAATGGGINVTIALDGPNLAFSVADTGPGIGPDDVKHLFERYWRSNDAGYKGTGLGLAIAKGIVLAHGGRIWVESALGVGSTFRFTVPLVAPAVRA